MSKLIKLSVKYHILLIILQQLVEAIVTRNVVISWNTFLNSIYNASEFLFYFICTLKLRVKDIFNKILRETNVNE